MKQLTEREFERITNRAGPQNQSTDYFRINGKPYLVGDSAERQGLITQRTGTARYTRDYHGVLAAVALGRLYDRSRDISVFGIQPPGDVQIRQDLIESVIGDWTINIKGKERLFRVSYANTFVDPAGGLMNGILTEDGGQHYQHTDINGGRALVIDIGGYTTDWLAVNPGGEIDYSPARSIPLGI